MRHLLPIILIALLVFMPSCKYFNGGKKAKTLALLLARQDSIRIADSLRNIQDQLLALENAKNDSVRKADEQMALADKLKYNIIVGSFITPEYAKGLAQVYKEKGYETRILKKDGSRFELVAAEGHDSFRKAFARLKAFQDTVDLDSWMYIKK